MKTEDLKNIALALAALAAGVWAPWQFFSEQRPQKANLEYQKTLADHRQLTALNLTMEISPLSSWVTGRRLLEIRIKISNNGSKDEILFMSDNSLRIARVDLDNNQRLTYHNIRRIGCYGISEEGQNPELVQSVVVFAGQDKDVDFVCYVEKTGVYYAEFVAIPSEKRKDQRSDIGSPERNQVISISDFFRLNRLVPENVAEQQNGVQHPIIAPDFGLSEQPSIE